MEENGLNEAEVRSRASVRGVGSGAEGEVEGGNVWMLVLRIRVGADLLVALRREELGAGFSPVRHDSVLVLGVG